MINGRALLFSSVLAGFYAFGALAQQMELGMVAATCMADDPADMVVGIEDIRKPATTGGALGQHWNDNNTNQPPTLHEPDWIRGNLGQVFGLALDGGAPPDIFVASTDIYSNQDLGPLGRAAVYRLRYGGGLTDGSYEVFHEFSDPGRTAGLGQIAYHLDKKILYVSDFETGLIHILKDNGDSTPPTSMGTFDHGLARINDPAYSNTEPDDGGPGRSSYGRLVWAVQVNYLEERLYYGVVTFSNHEIWSVPILPDGTLDSLQVSLELEEPKLATSFTSKRTFGISDIAFPVDHQSMLVAERSIIDPSINYAHVARARHFIGNSGNWSLDFDIPVGAIDFGTVTHFNSAGGIDFNYAYLGNATDIELSDADGNVVVTGDALNFALSPLHLSYGLQISSLSDAAAPHNLANYYLVDLDGVSDAADKAEIGDVEAYRERSRNVDQPLQCLAEARFSEARCSEEDSDSYDLVLNFTNQNPFGTAATLITLTPPANVTVNSINNDPGSTHVFSTPLGSGQSATLPVSISASGQGGQNICFWAELGRDGDGDDDWCCPSQEVCVELPVCTKDCIEEYRVECDGAGNCTLAIGNTGQFDIAEVVLSSATGATFTPSSFAVNIAPGNSDVLPFTVNPPNTGVATVTFNGFPVDDTAWLKGCCEQIITWEPRQGGRRLADLGLPFLQLVFDRDDDGMPDEDIAVPAGRAISFQIEGEDGEFEAVTQAEGYVALSTLAADPSKPIRLSEKSREALGIRSEGPFVTEFATITRDAIANPKRVFLK